MDGVMKKIIMGSVLLLLSMFFSPAWAEDAVLKVNGDLMIHPDQLNNFFTIAADKIKNSGTWDWPSLTFTKPYKTAWSQVQAHGPFNIQFDTSGLKNQEFAFTLSWADPTLTIGNFEIHDTVTRDVGGAHLIIHLDGACSNMAVHIPGGQWVVRGKMHWDLNSQAFLVVWEDFNFQMANVVPQVDVGQCKGQPALIRTLHDTIVSITQDQSWMQDVLKQGVLDWVQSSLGGLQTELLTERKSDWGEHLKLAWQPATLTTLPGGLIRVAGVMVLAKPGSTLGADILVRNYDAQTLSAVTESGYVLPKDFLQHALSYLFVNGELQYRLNSSKLAAFEALMQSRFLQFFVWPDLMSFREQTQFIFDLTSEQAPKLGVGSMLTGGGSSYSFSAPMIAHQWAPASTEYLPYVDFRAPLTGRLTAKIQNGVLSLQTTTQNELNLKAQFRPEFARLRSENTWIATSLLGSRVRDYLNATPFTLAVPSWSLGSGVSLGVRDLQAWKQSFRIPLDFSPIDP